MVEAAVNGIVSFLKRSGVPNVAITMLLIFGPSIVLAYATGQTEERFSERLRILQSDNGALKSQVDQLFAMTRDMTTSATFNTERANVARRFEDVQRDHAVVTSDIAALKVEAALANSAASQLGVEVHTYFMKLHGEVPSDVRLGGLR